MTSFIGVAVGGAAGSVLRWWAGLAVSRFVVSGFPWATLLINIAGSLLIGWMASATLPDGPLPASATLRLTVMTGFCGGFTTFSAFSLQTLGLVQQGALFAAAANVLGSVALCLAAVTLGYHLGARAL
jgi:CrcB protein